MTDTNAMLIGGASSGQVKLDASMANRHGLITGATGTGKTVTLQVLAESFSRLGVPVFTADVKGDLSGVATAGNTLGGAITFAMGALLQKGLSGSVWHGRIERLFRLDDRSLARVHRWGIPALFFSWMPIIGDPLCLAGGYLRLATVPSLVMIFLGKFVRYAVLLWIYAQPWAQPPGS